MESGMQMPEMIEKTVTTLATMLDYLGLVAEIKAEEKNGRIIVKATSEEAGRIIGRRGQTLESLQFLVNRMMLKFDKAFPRIVLDVDGYAKGPSEKKERNDQGQRRDNKERCNIGNETRNSSQRKFSDHKDVPASDDGRDAILKQQAIDAAKEVKRWGDTVSLPPMNSHERRVIHTSLKDDLEITTESLETDNPNLKRVVVKLSSSIPQKP